MMSFYFHKKHKSKPRAPPFQQMTMANRQEIQLNKTPQLPVLQLTLQLPVLWSAHISRAWWLSHNTRISHISIQWYQLRTLRLLKLHVSQMLELSWGTQIVAAANRPTSTKPPSVVLPAFAISRCAENTSHGSQKAGPGQLAATQATILPPPSLYASRSQPKLLPISCHGI